jgi:hypothetical protein
MCLLVCVCAQTSSPPARNTVAVVVVVVCNTVVVVCRRCCGGATKGTVELIIQIHREGACTRQGRSVRD